MSDSAFCPASRCEHALKKSTHILGGQRPRSGGGRCESLGGLVFEWAPPHTAHATGSSVHRGSSCGHSGPFRDGTCPGVKVTSSHHGSPTVMPDAKNREETCQPPPLGSGCVSFCSGYAWFFLPPKSHQLGAPAPRTDDVRKSTFSPFTDT